MTSSTALDGLLHWLRRDPWAAAFDGVLLQHLGPACAKAGIEIADLATVLDSHLAMTLWGCALEDFLTRDVDGVGNIVDSYLKRRGFKEKVRNKAYMAALRSSVFSLYEVSDVRLNESFLARDLVRGGEPTRISERSATRSLKQWDRIACRVVEVRGTTEISGGLLPYPREASESLMAALLRVRTQSADKRPEELRDVPPELRQAVKDRLSDTTEILRHAAPLVTTFWLNDVLERTLNPAVPELHNTEGEPVEFFTLHYPLRARVTQRQVRQALATLPDLQQETTSFWNWLAPKGADSVGAPEKSRRGLTLSSTMDDGARVLGNLEIKGRTLTLSVNSEGRAARGRDLLAPVLGTLVGEPEVERQDVAELVATQREGAKGTVALDGLSAEDQREITHGFMDDHYREQLDQPISILGGITPRQAAATEAGREKLVDWLKLLENGAATHDSSAPMADYDLTWLWEELGVLALRK